MIYHTLFAMQSDIDTSSIITKKEELRKRILALNCNADYFLYSASSRSLNTYGFIHLPAFEDFSKVLINGERLRKGALIPNKTNRFRHSRLTKHEYNCITGSENTPKYVIPDYFFEVKRTGMYAKEYDLYSGLIKEISEISKEGNTLQSLTAYRILYSSVKDFLNAHNIETIPDNVVDYITELSHICKVFIAPKEQGSMEYKKGIMAAGVKLNLPTINKLLSLLSEVLKDHKVTHSMTSLDRNTLDHIRYTEVEEWGEEDQTCYEFLEKLPSTLAELNCIPFNNFLLNKEKSMLKVVLNDCYPIVL